MIYHNNLTSSTKIILHLQPHIYGYLSCFPWRDFILALFLVIVLLRLHTKHITYFELPPCVAGPFKNIYGNPNSVAIMLSVSSFIRLKNVGIV